MEEKTSVAFISTGIKVKIVRKFEENRARSQSSSAVVRSGQNQSADGTITESDLLGLSGHPSDYEEVERAEEADPERLTLEQVL